MTYKTVINWESSATTKPTKTKRRTRSSAPVNYPIFREASKYTDDPEWHAILLKAELGQFPTGFSYSKDTICYRGRSGGEDIKMISTIDPNDFLNEIRTFMNKHGVLSKIDKNNTTDDQVIIDGDDWLSMPTRYRQAIIGKFVSSETVKNKLSHNEIDQLMYIIRIGQLIGAFEKTDFTVENFTMVYIRRLYYDSQKRKYYIDPNFIPISKPLSKLKPSTKTTKTYSDYWELFLKSENELINNFRVNSLPKRSKDITESETEDYSSTL